MTDHDRSHPEETAAGTVVPLPRRGVGGLLGAEGPPRAASGARIYDYLLGGKDNFAVDRLAARRVIAAMPGARKLARANRRFLVRAVRYAAEVGVRQFIDLGTGFPTSPNVHEVAHRSTPGYGSSTSTTTR